MGEVGDFSYNTISTGSNSPNNAKSGYINRQLPDHIGIDKLHIRIPLIPEDTDGHSAQWKKKRFIPTANGSSIHWLETHLEVAERLDIHLKVFNLGAPAEIQFNPSRVMDADGSSLCSVEALEATVIFVIRQISHLITPTWFLDMTSGEVKEAWPSGWLEQAEITRLDIAVDITSNISFNVEKVLKQVAGRLKKMDATLNYGFCNSLTWGSPHRLREVFYNKGAHPLHKNSDGVFRFECQLHSRYLKEKSVQSVHHITAEWVMEIAKKRWEKSRLGIPFSLNGGLVHLLSALDKQVSTTKANGFLGVALRMSQGVDSGCNPKTLVEYKSLGESVGFALGSPLDSLGSSTYKLNWRTGTMDEVA